MGRIVIQCSPEDYPLCREIAGSLTNPNSMTHRENVHVIVTQEHSGRPIGPAADLGGVVSVDCDIGDGEEEL